VTHLSNEDLYDAMMPAEGTAEPFVVDETSTGIRITIKEARDPSDPGDPPRSSRTGWPDATYTMA
jgi:hypothetical protein